VSKQVNRKLPGRNTRV